MYNLQGIIRKNVINAQMQFEKLGYESNNIANYNTPSYKGVRFEQMLSEDGYLTGVKRTNHATGSYFITKNPLDIALGGPGFIPVTTKAGDILYTRDGSFTKNNEGMLITQSGDLVGAGIKLPLNAEKIEFKKDGRIFAYQRADDTPELIGELPIVQFENPEGLQQMDGNKFKATAESGTSQIVKEHDYITQYGVERSNVNIHETVNQVLRLNASMLASTSLMRVVDDMYNKSINIRQ